MNNNLYQVIKEDDVDKILSDNDTKLVVICYIVKQPGFYKQFKNFIKSLSITFPLCFFVVIDINNFDNKTGKYIKNVTNLPKLIIYLNFEILGETTNKFNQQEIIDSLQNISNMIEDKFKNAKKNNEINVQEKVSHINNLCTPQNIAELEKIKIDEVNTS